MSKIETYNKRLFSSIAQQQLIDNPLEKELVRNQIEQKMRSLSVQPTYHSRQPSKLNVNLGKLVLKNINESINSDFIRQETLEEINKNKWRTERNRQNIKQSYDANQIFQNIELDSVQYLLQKLPRLDVERLLYGNRQNKNQSSALSKLFKSNKQNKVQLNLVTRKSFLQSIKQDAAISSKLHNIIFKKKKNNVKKINDDTQLHQSPDGSPLLYSSKSRRNSQKPLINLTKELKFDIDKSQMNSLQSPDLKVQKDKFDNKNNTNSPTRSVIFDLGTRIQSPDSNSPTMSLGLNLGPLKNSIQLNKKIRRQSHVKSANQYFDQQIGYIVQDLTHAIQNQKFEIIQKNFAILIVLAIQLDSPLILIELFLIMGKIFMDCEFLVQSLHYLNLARCISDVIQEFPLKSRILLELAYCFVKFKKFNHAEIMANRAIHYCFKYENNDVESAAFDLLGLIKFQTNNIQEAIYYHTRAMQGQKQRDNTTFQIIIDDIDSIIQSQKMFFNMHTIYLSRIRLPFNIFEKSEVINQNNWNVVFDNIKYGYQENPDFKFFNVNTFIDNTFVQKDFQLVINFFADPKVEWKFNYNVASNDILIHILNKRNKESDALFDNKQKILPYNVENFKITYKFDKVDDTQQMEQYAHLSLEQQINMRIKALPYSDQNSFKLAYQNVGYANLSKDEHLYRICNNQNIYEKIDFDRQNNAKNNLTFYVLKIERIIKYYRQFIFEPQNKYYAFKM